MKFLIFIPSSVLSIILRFSKLKICLKHCPEYNSTVICKEFSLRPGYINIYPTSGQIQTKPLEIFTVIINVIFQIFFGDSVSLLGLTWEPHQRIIFYLFFFNLKRVELATSKLECLDVTRHSRVPSVSISGPTVTDGTATNRLVDTAKERVFDSLFVL